MADDLLIRPATPEDAGEILDLVKLSLGEGKVPRHIDYWQWKHRDNPFGPSPCLLAVSAGQLVGLRVFMRWTWRASGAKVPAVRAVDTATHPEWRGRGIFSRLTLALVEQMKGEGIAFVFNTPNDQSRPGYLKMGWESVGRTSLWVRPLRPIKIIRSLLTSGNSGSAGGGVAPGVEVGTAVWDLLQEPGFRKFLETLPEFPDRFSTPRSSEYLRWRYVEIPSLEYRAAWQLDGVEGAAIIFRFKQGGALRELRLCDVLVGNTGKSKRMGQDLVCSLVRRGEAHFASAMAVTGTPGQRVLLRSGFFPAPRMGPMMTVRVLNGVRNGPDPLLRTGWDLSIGDLELF
jgi:GNAT superfamily N-acetyltransferase